LRSFGAKSIDVLSLMAQSNQPLRERRWQLGVDQNLNSGRHNNGTIRLTRGKL
jgi:hypothetical protein